ncbi:MAG: sugar ABC transporter substrate-binding protein [Anaerolineae bacterium]|nr:sugar ABC transporter substrate-binding protein [Anaerolineae bacterium]
MKAFKILVLVAIVLAIAVPVGVSAQDKQEVTLWFHSGQGNERDALDAQITAFNEASADYVITPLEVPEGSYNDQVKAAALAGELPCVLDFDGPFVYNYVFAGDLIPLDDYASDDLLADILPSIIDQGMVDGQLWSLGQFDSGLAIWGNKAMLEEAGVRIPEGIEDTWTLDEFNAAMDALAGVIPEDGYVIDFKFTYTGEWYSYAFGPWIRSFGGDTIDKETMDTAEGVLNGPEAVAFGEWFQGLFEKGYATATPVDPDADFIEGRVPLSYVGHWMYVTYKEAMGDNLVLIPQPDFGAGAVTGMGSWNWSITSACPNPDGAWAFIEHLMQPDNMAAMSAAGGAIPARISVLEADERFAEGGDMYIYYQQLAEGVAVPRAATAAYPAIQTGMSDAINAIARGEDVQASLDGAVDTIDTLIESLAQ